VKKSFPFLILFMILLLSAQVQAAEVDSVKLTDSERGNVVVLTSAKTSGFLHYVNQRFGYVVDIPDTFTNVILLPDNGDGLILATQDGQAQFRASGGEYIEGTERTLRQSFDEAQGYLPVKAAFTLLEKDFWVLSWRESDVIHYRKFMLRNNVWCDFEMTYPFEQKQQYLYAVMVQHVEESLAINTR
jgi:hypothetical protein